MIRAELLQRRTSNRRSGALTAATVTLPPQSNVLKPTPAGMDHERPDEHLSHLRSDCLSLPQPHRGRGPVALMYLFEGICKNPHHAMLGPKWPAMVCCLDPYGCGIATSVSA